jgi:hypothetical protein
VLEVSLVDEHCLVKGSSHAKISSWHIWICAKPEQLFDNEEIPATEAPSGNCGEEWALSIRRLLIDLRTTAELLPHRDQVAV